jgi:hypothetical protein
MTSSEIPSKSRIFEEIVLWIAIVLFIAPGIAYMAYPEFYYHHHPRPIVPIHPVKPDGRAASPWLAYFFFAGITAFFGFCQTRFSRWWSTIAAMFLNFGYALFREPHD